MKVVEKMTCEILKLNAADQVIRPDTRKTKTESVLKKLLASGVSADDILAKLK